MSRRSLWPREHGAYFQLAVPLASACMIQPPTLPMVALALAACLAFLANEPLLVLLGHRGRRRLELDGRRARVRIALLGGGALAAGLAGLAAGPGPAVPAAAVVGVPVLALLVAAWRRAEHTIPGELIAAVALTGAAVPVLVSGGRSLGGAAEIWLGWATGFAATVLAVHRVIARHRRPGSVIDVGLAVGLLAVVLGTIVTSSPGLRIAAPLAGLSMALVITPPPATRLRTVGVVTAVVAVGTATLAVLQLA